MHKLKGDTLIEVALAIGIFSLVAITVVSVVSASTSGAQSSLELTITREELDAQAEALRFIHDSYVTGSQSKDTSENAYAALWQSIVGATDGSVRGLAVNETTAKNSGALSYNPQTCSGLYNGSGAVNRYTSDLIPFVINTRQLNNPSSANISNVVITSGQTGSSSVFYPPTTYPRIIYGGRSFGSDVTSEDLLAQATESSDRLQRVEGIYIIAVKDDGSPIVSGTGGSVSSKPAYYDFYIRSCWMPIGSERASTISTVVRLYDPAVITY